MSTGLGPHLDIGNNEQEKKDLVQSQTSIGKIVGYLTCYTMSVKASSQGQKTLLHPFIHLFICITLCTGAHSGACSVSVPGFLVKFVNK